MPDGNAMPRIALYLRDLGAGGVQRVMLDLALGLHARGCAVDVVVNRAAGVHAVPDGVRLVELKAGLGAALRGRYLPLRALPQQWRVLTRHVLLSRSGGKKRLPTLVDYLRENAPVALISAFPFCNVTALWAAKLAGVPTRVIVTEHSPLWMTNNPAWRSRLALARCTYPIADAIVAVSAGLADDLARSAGLPRERITVIHNPVVPLDLAERTAVPPPHPWLAERDGPPVIVAAGRLHAQKNFPLLLHAFARLRRARPARLVIFGEGENRARLEALARQLGLANDLALPGFIPNPYAAFARAALFVLSSDYEGLPGVLIQALACGCPVVSTDCPHGPAEILAGGRFGELVPVGDAERLAGAMARTLDRPLPAELLRGRGGEFGQARSVARYLDLATGNA
jgi:glycosyltransferase involved in cell wall biosynthesis